MAFKRLKYNWKELNRRDKTDIMTVAIMRQILMRGNNSRIGMREVNVNIGKNKSNLRIDVLEINRQKNVLVGYEIKSCIEDFRADKKWEKYLNLINQLYFVFDINTYEQYTVEILKRIGDKAGIYVFNPAIDAIYLIMGVTYKELPGKDETFYRTILFNYLFRKALREINGG